MTDDLLPINHRLAIPLSELSFRYARSGGPGGQHVQRTETKVELLFDVARSPSLSEEQRQLILTRLAGRIDSEGVLHLTSQAGRSQAENRAEVIERFRRLLAAALQPRKPRRPTRPSQAARERRLAHKRRRSQVKHMRRTSRLGDLE
ncbi:MAG: aminoacyl-tRNA hydrolase [Caldilineales bacterium]|nr:aminoacyl-tRNA hydrolase [Caldilineales bacterium]MDW8317506.1 alternative ribosome rescue aminoacyl-tRNA hydrolase ArfB [Anaerolineae bacterium]